MDVRGGESNNVVLKKMKEYIRGNSRNPLDKRSGAWKT